MHLDYQVDISLRKRHLFQVRLDIPAHSQQVLNISLPAWIPGSYMIRDFAKHIVSINATCPQSGAPLTLNKQDKQRWTLHSGGKACTLNYQVYAFDSSVRTAYLDDNRGFFNGTSLFLQVEELSDCSHRLKLLCPEDQPHWRVATGLSRANGTDKYAFGNYQASNYAQLIDCPVEMGNFDALEFEVLGIPHHLILTGKHYADHARLIRDLTKLCELHIRMFDPKNKKAPFSEYWFLTNILPEGFGGLEHRNSTALLCSNFDFPNQQRPNELTEGYKTFLSLASHEYFHAWNVCRIKPQELIAPKLGQENHTSQLWAFEGITSYYDDLSLYRTGLIAFGDYLALLSKTLTRVQRGQGELKQSVADSSFDSWTRFYQQGEDAVNNIVSYYTKGAMVALWMDLTIRQQSQGKHSLDDVMRALWQQFGQTGQGTTEEDFISLLNQFCGNDQSAAFKDILHSNKRLELDDLLAQVGVKVSRGTPRPNDLLAAESNEHSPYLGFQYRAHPLGLEVLMVLEDSPAEQAGVCAKDILIALDGMKLDAANLLSLLQNQPLDQPITLHLFRHQQLHALRLVPSSAPHYVVELGEQDAKLSANWQKVIGQ
ncbi:PDZ domain-containing protein [Bowmanella sp. Y26]|uniref:M61 family metallopeptidase n=1 Tax=Bowmanella yangjiangensis TaxID=2811230 RepID=UPI001BDD9908|nr:PDZ domain-containing protein [Bowmanella yangjiangensis]MBT1063467.1 PDZ domain-containing protein [Bowmanella yangjiangensis]